MTTHSSKPSDSYPWGDYEWFAMDADECVAVFTTAGIGPVPSVVISSLSVTNSLAAHMWKMPMRGQATMFVSLPRPDDYIHFASRGFYAYDWQDVHRTKGFTRNYEMLSRPEKPIHVSELPEQFQPLLRNIVFAGVRFADSSRLDVGGYFDCESAAR